MIPNHIRKLYLKRAIIIKVSYKIDIPMIYNRTVDYLNYRHSFDLKTSLVEYSDVLMITKDKMPIYAKNTTGYIVNNFLSDLDNKMDTLSVEELTELNNEL